MKFDTADLFSERSDVIQKKARSFAAVIAAGKPCSRCGSPATAEIAGDYYCALDAQITRGSRRHAAMRGR